MTLDTASMFAAVRRALRDRDDLAAWSLRHITSRGTQLYAVPAGVEARRSVTNERFVVDVLRQARGPADTPSCGAGNVTLLPGDDIGAALDAASLMAGLVHNPPHSIPAPADLPEVATADPELQVDPTAALDRLYGQLRGAAAAEPRVRMTAAEFHAAEETVRLVNSRGIDASQTTTSVAAEWVLIAREGAREVESFVELTRRRAADLHLEVAVAHSVRQAVDLLTAGPATAFAGPVILRGATLGTFMNCGVIQTLSAAASKFGKLSTWEIGQPVFRGEVSGDPLTVWANRRLPFGTHAARFDDEGLPAQRVALIENGRLRAFTASQRYADYLALPATGAFGDIEVAPGKTPAAELLAEPHVEIVTFSWFNPDEVTGDFACEIRLGYRVEGGVRTPFRGGLLVGNVLDALAAARWSEETGFYGDYQGPTTARFGHVTVAAA
jgi:predicted Zn-dependent protease